MAEFLIDEQQFERLMQLKQSVDDLSTNTAKWQAQQINAIQAGFAGLIAALTGADIDEVQENINLHASKIAAVREKVQSSIDRNQPKETE